ncbi:hypothetical protein HAX54_047890 [Datura stramonium]|uniref:Uncharacterized protein n=1 Tax=Datura stramonium TaxID=4076 RepID=A0ABS8WMH4_DATST|nr:hypothetical protein [Datura stramonium]
MAQATRGSLVPAQGQARGIPPSAHSAMPGAQKPSIRCYAWRAKTLSRRYGMRKVALFQARSGTHNSKLSARYGRRRGKGRCDMERLQKWGKCGFPTSTKKRKIKSQAKFIKE